MAGSIRLMAQMESDAGAHLGEGVGGLVDMDGDAVVEEANG